MPGTTAKVVSIPDCFLDGFPPEEKSFLASLIGHTLAIDETGVGTVTLTATDEVTGIMHFLVLPIECIMFDT